MNYIYKFNILDIIPISNDKKMVETINKDKIYNNQLGREKEEHNVSISIAAAVTAIGRPELECLWLT